MHDFCVYVETLPGNGICDLARVGAQMFRDEYVPFPFYEGDTRNRNIDTEKFLKSPRASACQRVVLISARFSFIQFLHCAHRCWSIRCHRKYLTRRPSAPSVVFIFSVHGCRRFSGSTGSTAKRNSRSFARQRFRPASLSDTSAAGSNYHADLSN